MPLNNEQDRKDGKAEESDDFSSLRRIGEREEEQEVNSTKHFVLKTLQLCVQHAVCSTTTKNVLVLQLCVAGNESFPSFQAVFFNFTCCVISHFIRRPHDRKISAKNFDNGRAAVIERHTQKEIILLYFT